MATALQHSSLDIVDIKPPSIEELTEVITTATFHPTLGHMFAFCTSKGSVRIGDMRDAAVCDRHCRSFKAEEPSAGAFFNEVVSSISDVKFARDGRFFVTRDYLNVLVWDLHMETRPVRRIAGARCCACQAVRPVRERLDL